MLLSTGVTGRDGHDFYITDFVKMYIPVVNFCGQIFQIYINVKQVYLYLRSRHTLYV